MFIGIRFLNLAMDVAECSHFGLLLKSAYCLHICHMNFTPKRFHPFKRNLMDTSDMKLLGSKFILVSISVAK